jgi:DNA helicase HerA-like ATPase
MKLLLGRDATHNEPVYLDASGARAVLICGKRGSGKSYTLGVFVEELLAAAADQIIPIVVDPIGVYHTMSLPNELQRDDLFHWALNPRGYPVRLLVPGDPESLYDHDVLRALQERQVEVISLQLNAADLSPDGWCELFGANINQPLGIVLFRSVQSLSERGHDFTVRDISLAVEADERANETTQEALLNRLEAARAWRIFAEDGYKPIDVIFQPGVINIVDLSRLESGPRSRRNLTISVIARNLFRARADARLREEFGLASPLPRVWLAIDEAHQFVPASGTTLAKEQLVRWAKEGRQPGLSLIVASQQPSAVDREVLSQCDVILSHKLTTRDDVSALNRLSQDYMGGELQAFIKKLKRVGEAILVDDERETVHHLGIRPRQSRHGGSSVSPAEEERLDLWGS